MQVKPLFPEEKIDDGIVFAFEILSEIGKRVALLLHVIDMHAGCRCGMIPKKLQAPQTSHRCIKDRRSFLGRIKKIDDLLQKRIITSGYENKLFPLSVLKYPIVDEFFGKGFLPPILTREARSCTAGISLLVDPEIFRNFFCRHYLHSDIIAKRFPIINPPYYEYPPCL